MTRFVAWVHGDFDLHDVAEFEMVGDGGDRTFLGLQHIQRDLRRVGQKRAAPSAGGGRLKWASAPSAAN